MRHAVSCLSRAARGGRRDPTVSEPEIRFGTVSRHPPVDRTGSVRSKLLLWTSSVREDGEGGVRVEEVQVVNVLRRRACRICRGRVEQVLWLAGGVLVAHGLLAEVREARDFKWLSEEVVDAGKWLKLSEERAGCGGLGGFAWR